MIHQLFNQETTLRKNFILFTNSYPARNQTQTNDVFSEKWEKVNNQSETERLSKFQRDWFLKLYGFEDKHELESFSQSKKVVLDAGCGLGYKSAWFAELAPESTVIGMDLSTAAYSSRFNKS